MLYRRENKGSLILDLSPLIDVVFLLLIFFMVSTTFKDDHGLDLNLPKTESTHSAETENLTIQIDSGSQIWISGERQEKEGLRASIQSMLADKESKMVVLNADENVPHGLVVEVMDAAKSAGATGITYAAAAKKNKE